MSNYVSLNDASEFMIYWKVSLRSGKSQLGLAFEREMVYYVKNLVVMMFCTYLDCSTIDKLKKKKSQINAKFVALLLSFLLYKSISLNVITKGLQ